MPLPNQRDRWLVRFSIFMVIAAFALLNHPAELLQAASETVVFRNIRIFEGEKVIANTMVLVRDGKIEAVGNQIKVPDGAQVIDGTGLTLLPGLIDCHTHAFGSALQQALIFGVTTELDMFTDHKIAAEMRQEQKQGKGLDRADLFSAGTLVTAPGGHGTEYGITIPTISRPDEALSFVDARIAEGSDYIKIIYDDGKVYGLNFPTIDKATMSAVVAAAHQRGKLAVVHIGTLEGARTAIESGADGLVHLFTDRTPDADFGRYVASHKAFVVPTLTVLESVSGTPSGASLVSDPILVPYLNSTDIASLKMSFPFRSGITMHYEGAEDSVRQLKAAGVPLLAGTDAPNPGTAHGVSIHRELELLVRAGLTPVEALKAATSVPARIFRLSDRGRIAPGLRADLLLVKGDPTTDIKTTRNIVGVWKLGAPVDRRSYLAAVEKTKAAARQEADAPAPAGSESGMVSDFEAEKPSARFGAGWMVSTDSFMGGKSTAEIKVVPGGARNSKGSLMVTGKIAEGTIRFAGAMFFTGQTPMAPANLSIWKEVSFWAKGDGKTYRIMLFAQSTSMRPVELTFVSNPEWKEYTFSFSQFQGVDAHGLMGIFLGGGPTLGDFSFQIDDVRLR